MNRQDREYTLSALRHRFHDAGKVHARLTELGIKASLIEAECLRTFDQSFAILDALSAADLQPRSRQLVEFVLGKIQHRHACMRKLGEPLPELPRRRYSHRRRDERPEHAGRSTKAVEHCQ